MDARTTPAPAAPAAVVPIEHETDALSDEDLEHVVGGLVRPWDILDGAPMTLPSVDPVSAAGL